MAGEQRFRLYSLTSDSRLSAWAAVIGGACAIAGQAPARTVDTAGIDRPLQSSGRAGGVRVLPAASTGGGKTRFLKFASA